MFPHLSCVSSLDIRHAICIMQSISNATVYSKKGVQSTLPPIHIVVHIHVLSIKLFIIIPIFYYSQSTPPTHQQKQTNQEKKRRKEVNKEVYSLGRAGHVTCDNNCDWPTAHDVIHCYVYMTFLYDNPAIKSSNIVTYNT